MATTAIYKHNPRQVPAEELRATFVAREAILDDILRELRARAKAPANQHLLVIGPRGIGKTNLLLMIRYGVLADETLASAYLPIQTAEEEYSIADLRQLFARILDLILTQTPDEELASVAEALTGIGDDEHAAERAIEAVRAFAKRSGRKILLLIDNLDLILGDQITDTAQLGRLRDLLMNDSFLVLIGAAPTYFREVSGYERPFYHFFRTLNLQELTPEQMTEMLRKRAEWDGNGVLLDRMDELTPRIRAVHHLTGGNPRLALMLYQLCTANELPEVRTAVQTLLDDVTPYYRARLEQLPAQQRRVMDTFARLGRPATPTELATETRIPINQVNSILQRLRGHGFVTLAPQERRKKSYYMVSERLFRIWHQMRYSNPQWEFLAEFARIWYTSEEPEAVRTARECEGEPPTGHLIREAAEEYVASESQAAVRTALSRCARAAKADDRGRAQTLFRSALDMAPRPVPNAVLQDLADFLLRVADEKTAGLCAEFLAAIRSHALVRVISVLEPFVKAIEYWQSGKDAEVLDRLNPEVRELVEQIVRRRGRVDHAGNPTHERSGSEAQPVRRATVRR